MRIFTFKLHSINVDLVIQEKDIYEAMRHVEQYWYPDAFDSAFEVSIVQGTNMNTYRGKEETMIQIAKTDYYRVDLNREDIDTPIRVIMFNSRINARVATNLIEHLERAVRVLLDGNDDRTRTPY